MVLEHPSKDMNLKGDAQTSLRHTFGVLTRKERVVWAFLDPMSKYGPFFVDYINTYSISTSILYISFLHRRPLALITIKTDSNNSSIRKLARKKQSRRITNMMKKAYEYSKICNADVSVGIRMRGTRQVQFCQQTLRDFGFFLLHILYTSL